MARGQRVKKGKGEVLRVEEGAGDGETAVI